MSRREQMLQDANARSCCVACPSCRAPAGEPCRSCMGNVTFPHQKRVLAAAESRAV